MLLLFLWQDVMQFSVLWHAHLCKKSLLLQVDFKKYAREGFGLHYASILVSLNCSSSDIAA